jgi:preprotein translocase subunit SecD
MTRKSSRKRRLGAAVWIATLALSSVMTACSQPAETRAADPRTPDTGLVIRAIDEGLFANQAGDDKFGSDSHVLWLKRQAIVTGAMVASATNNYDVSTPPWEQRYISVTLTPEGQQRLKKFGDSHPDVRVAILLNGTVVATGKGSRLTLDGRFLLGPLDDTVEVRRVMQAIRRGASGSSRGS